MNKSTNRFNVKSTNKHLDASFYPCGSLQAVLNEIHANLGVHYIIIKLYYQFHMMAART